MTGCRIGKVKLKAGGATLHKLEAPAGDEIQHQMRISAARIAGTFDEGEMRGYVAIGWNAEGGYKVGWRMDVADSSIGFTLMPSWIADIMRRELIQTRVWDALKEEAE